LDTRNLYGTKGPNKMLLTYIIYIVVHNLRNQLELLGKLHGLKYINQLT
jgi:hypothetical protein